MHVLDQFESIIPNDHRRPMKTHIFLHHGKELLCKSVVVSHGLRKAIGLTLKKGGQNARQENRQLRKHETKKARCHRLMKRSTGKTNENRLAVAYAVHMDEASLLLCRGPFYIE